MSKLKPTKIPASVIYEIAVEQGVIEETFNWVLVRERDKVTKQSKDVKWIEWKEDGTFKEQFEEVAIGRSLIMSPFNRSFTWQTTTVTEIIEQREDYLKFKTGNSNYELVKM
jgi:orotate phosphoribosyltransferase-like protein